MATGNYERSDETGDLAWCYDAVESVSRTFAITVDRLAEPMARRICVGYLLCRVPDTVEDAAHIPPETQVELLETYAEVLDPEQHTDVEQFRRDVDRWIPPVGRRSADWAVVANVDRVVGAFRRLGPEATDVITIQVQEMARGMADFVERYAADGGLRIRTIEELETYCWYVAGTVGAIVTELLSRSDADRETGRILAKNANAFALVLQLVNVAKDVAVDYREENNVYLPTGWFRDEGVDPEAVADPDNATGVGRAVRRLVDHAAGYLDGAQTWLERMPETDGNTLGAWAIPYLLAVATMRELRDRPEDVVLQGDVKVTRGEVYALLGRFDDGVSPSEIGVLRERIEHSPLHQGG